MLVIAVRSSCNGTPDVPPRNPYTLGTLLCSLYIANRTYSPLAIGVFHSLGPTRKVYGLVCSCNDSDT